MIFRQKMPSSEVRGAARRSPDCLSSLDPHGQAGGGLRVINVSACADGQYLQAHLDSERQKCVGFLSPPGARFSRLEEFFSSLRIQYREKLFCAFGGEFRSDAVAARLCGAKAEPLQRTHHGRAALVDRVDCLGDADDIAALACKLADQLRGINPNLFHLPSCFREHLHPPIAIPCTAVTTGASSPQRRAIPACNCLVHASIPAGSSKRSLANIRISPPTQKYFPFAVIKIARASLFMEMESDQIIEGFNEIIGS